MTEALQAHNEELQKYLSTWSKKQHELLETISKLPSSTGPGTYDLQQHWADKIQITCASTVVAPTSTSSRCGDIDEHLRINGSVESAPAALTEAQQVINLETGEIAGRIGERSEAHSIQDVINCNPLESYRSELVEKCETLLITLKSMNSLKKDNIKSWLVNTLSELQEQLPALEELHDKPDVDFPTARSNKPSVLGTLNASDSKKGVCERFHEVIGIVVHSNPFDMLSATVIIVNAVVMGIAADYQMNNLDGAENSALNYLETCFFVFYSIELCLRFSAQGRRFFIGRDWRWNWFDFALVILSSYDQVGPLLTPSKGSPTVNVSFLRLFRLLKMAKLLRMIRLMKMFKHLRLILASIFGSAQAMFWACVLVLIISYMASVLFVNLCSNFLMDATAKDLDISLDVLRGIDQYWSSVTIGMKSVFGATTGGDSWFNIVAPLASVGWGCTLLFSFYLGFFLVVVLNTFSSLFVQSVLELSMKDDEYLIEEEMCKKDLYIHELEEFFASIDDDGSGNVTLAEFTKHLSDPKLQAWASCLDIEVDDAAYFFGVLSSNGKISIDLENFVVGCIRLKGTAKSVDLMGVFQLAKDIHKRTEECCALAKEIRSRQQEILALTSLQPTVAAL